MHTRHYSSDFSSNFSSNIFRNIRARQIRGPVCIRRTVPTDIYNGVKLHRKLMGHLSSVYCVCFDQSGQYIFTGADDHLIKVWSARDGRLLSTLRGHDGEITDMSVDYENKFLASGSMDRVIRIWDIKTSRCLDCLSAHSAMVTSVKFSPYNRHGSHRYLISTSNDGCVIFWYYSIDNYQFRKLKKFQERNRPGGRILASSFSPGGSFLACVASDNFIHLYGFHPTIGPYWLKELEQHKSEVDSVQFANRGFRFVTGSTDGTAIIWIYRRAHWDSIKLDMSITLNHNEEELKLMPAKKPKVLIVQWSRDDRYVLTSTADHKIKVWESISGKLVHELKGHKHEIYILESHPIDPRIFISASHDGTMIIWDLDRAQPIKKFQNRVEDQPLESGPSTGAASIYDTKFSPDGAMIASTDSHGYLSLYGFGSSEPYRELPDQMFFHTDYRALIRDMRNFVLDDQTHIAPHLMPRPTLVDMNGNPYGQREQRFVPSYDGERVVVAPLSKAQIDTIASHITAHSHLEDEEYLHETEIPDDATVVYSDEDATVIDTDDDATVLYSSDDDDDDETVIYSDEATETASITTTNTNNNNHNSNNNNNTIRQPSYDYNSRPIRSTRNQRPASLAIYDYISRTPGIRTSARLRDRDRKRLCRSSTRMSAAPS